MDNFRKTSIGRVPLLEVESALFCKGLLHDFKQCQRPGRAAALLESVAKSFRWGGVTAFQQWHIAVRWVMIALCGLLASVGGIALGQDDPVNSGHDALQRAGNLPWYDAEADEVRPVNVRAPGEPPSRSDAESARPKQSNRGWFNSNGAPFGLLQLLQWTGWGLIGLFILLLLVFGIRSLASRGGVADLELPESSRRITSDADRIEQLPIPLKRDLSDLLGEARRQYEQGNYNEAIIYLYSYLLVELDRSQRIRLLRGKTNRQYLRELRDAPTALSGLVERTMVAFEDVFFGDRKLERDRFESCYNHLSEFQQHVEPATA